MTRKPSLQPLRLPGLGRGVRLDPAEDQGRGGRLRERAALADGRGDQPPVPGARVLLRVRELACVGGYHAHVYYGVMGVALGEARAG